MYANGMFFMIERTEVLLWLSQSMTNIEHG